MRISATLELLDLGRGNVDLAVRFVSSESGKGPVLFEEEVQPMCAPKLLRDSNRPLKSPRDLERHTLLTVEMRDEPLTVDWEPWLRVMQLPDGSYEVHVVTTSGGEVHVKVSKTFTVTGTETGPPAGAAPPASDGTTTTQSS